MALVPPICDSKWNTCRDFVIYGESGIDALEVKNAAKVRPADLRPLQAFREDYPDARCLLLYRGTEHFVRDNIRCMRCEAFLKALKPSEWPRW